MASGDNTIDILDLNVNDLGFTKLKPMKSMPGVSIIGMINKNAPADGSISVDLPQLMTWGADCVRDFTTKQPKVDERGKLKYELNLQFPTAGENPDADIALEKFKQIENK